MRAVIRTLTIAIFSVCYTLASLSTLSAQEVIDSSGPSVGEFLTPDGRFDLDAARRARFQGSLDMKGFESRFDHEGQPVFRSAANAATEGSPDDVYWDNSLSSSVPGVDEEVFALTVFEGKLIVGGYFTIAGGVPASNIAVWDGSA